MVLIKLGYDRNKLHNWKELGNDYDEEKYNDKLVVTIHQKLWEKVKNIIYIRKKGYDALILIDGKRRTGKSTLAMTIAYLLNPNISIGNYVSGIEEAPEKIDKAKDEDVLIFDEGSLVANSKDAMRKKNVQLEKIIDVVGVKKLTLIFCMPSFFNISRPIAISHSRFLIHVYTDERLNRGKFIYFGDKKKKKLYEIGKKNFGSYARPKADFTGNFKDFHLPFEEEYFRLKKESLREALDPDYKKKNKDKPLTESEMRNELIKKFVINYKKNYIGQPLTLVWKCFGINRRTLYTITKEMSYEEERKGNISIKLPQSDKRMSVQEVRDE